MSEHNNKLGGWRTTATSLHDGSGRLLGTAYASGAWEAQGFREAEYVVRGQSDSHALAQHDCFAFLEADTPNRLKYFAARAKTKVEKKK